MWTGDNPKLRLLVRPPAQNAPFRRVRFSSPGQTWRHLTEKRTLPPAPHGKAHSAACASRRSAFCPDRLTESRTLRSPDRTDCAFPSRCGARGVWGNPPRQAAGHYGEWLNWANALEQPPASLRGGLRQGPQISVRSPASRKDALCPTGGLQNALFRHDAAAECAFP